MHHSLESSQIANAGRNAAIQLVVEQKQLPAAAARRRQAQYSACRQAITMVCTPNTHERAARLPMLAGMLPLS
jgi:hypothetical protein